MNFEIGTILVKDCVGGQTVSVPYITDIGVVSYVTIEVNNNGNLVDWQTDSYTYSLSVSSFYTEVGTSTVTEFHICPICFEFTVVPLIKEHLGIEPYITEKN